MFANDRTRVRGVVFGLSQDGACTNLFENFREHSLKLDLPNDTTVNPSLFSLVITFKAWSIPGPGEPGMAEDERELTH